MTTQDVKWSVEAEEIRQSYLAVGVRPWYHPNLRGASTAKLVECVDELVAIDREEFAADIARLRLEIAFRGDGPEGV